MLLIASTASAIPLLPLAFFFDDPEDDRQEAISHAGQWNTSEMATINRPGFQLSYPANWQVATHQADYNPDKLFTIETDGQSHIVIEIYDITSKPLNQTMDEVMMALDGPAIETYSSSDFQEWGGYQGIGRHLKGKILSILPGGVRVFAAKVPEKGKGFLVTEFYMSDDLPSALPGFDLISQTFLLK
ncbi:MAG: hypothetical protein ACQKBV_10860 [Puniceicoccales bacterium]